MSDGDDNATPGRPRAAGADTDDALITRTPGQLPGAAPWERFGAPSRHNAGVHRRSAAPPAQRTHLEDVETRSVGGCHTDGGLTVADLIAKVGGSTADRPSHHRAAPETESPEESPDEAQYELRYGPDDEQNRPQDTYRIPVSAHAFELPDLDRPRHPRGTAGPSESEQPTVLPAASGRVPPVRIRGTSVPEDPAPKPKSRHHPMLLAGRTVAALVAAFALALTGGAWQWSTSKNNRFNNVSALDPHSRDIVDPTAQYGDENFLIVGMDSRAGANSEMGAGDTEDAGGVRSDTVMLVNIPANRNRVVVVSFPRDLAITPIQCEAWNPETGEYGPLYDEETGTYGPKYVYTETKLNSAFSFGGPKCLVKVIQKLSGLAINRFMAVDFVGFAKMVDALGGVEVCSTTPLEDTELGTVLAHAGRQVIDGTTALNYVRARQVTTEDNGDYGRIKRQQLFLSSLLRALISKDTFFSLSKLNNVVNMFINNSYVDNVKTKDLVDLGQSVQGVSAGHITFVTVPTGETDEDGNEPPRKADMRALFDAIINDDPLPGESDQNAYHSEKPTSPPRSTTTKAPQANPITEARAERVEAVTAAPQDITVQVSNSTGTSGLAATATEELEQHGFNVMTPDDYPSSLKSTTVFFSPGNEQAAATVASTFAHSKVERVTGIGQVVQVVLGSDFSSVSAPPPSGSMVSLQVDWNTTSTPTKLPEDLTVTNAADTTCE